MEPTVSTIWHFPIMILVSFVLFLVIILMVVGKSQFARQKNLIYVLSLLVVVIGMLFGKYGAQWGLPWWVYYPIPMLMTVLLPPIVLKMNTKQTILYLVLSFLSAPLIHTLFSFFLGWQEYMPFWDVPYWGDLF